MSNVEFISTFCMCIYSENINLFKNLTNLNTIILSRGISNIQFSALSNLMKLKNLELKECDLKQLSNMFNVLCSIRNLEKIVLYKCKNVTIEFFKILPCCQKLRALCIKECQTSFDIEYFKYIGCIPNLTIFDFRSKFLLHDALYFWYPFFDSNKLYTLLNNNISNSIKVLSLQNLRFESTNVFQKINEIMFSKNEVLTIYLRNCKFESGTYYGSGYFDCKECPLVKVVENNCKIVYWSNSCLTHDKKPHILNDVFSYEF